ncbi:MAG: F0F1 ATP synthase subunit gamma [Kiloniellales bacterium]|nr:F0F1 ATP synthase subunit gamma [Kiloniellales bacterium]
MPSLKDLRVRIGSVKSTQKITSAMKMVAAAKLRRAQEQAEASRPYAERMERMLSSLAEGAAERPGAPPLLAGNGKDQIHLIVVATADRGLCGGFNGNIAREARRRIEDLLQKGKTVKILCVGRKGRDQLRRSYDQLIIETLENLTKPSVKFDAAKMISSRMIELFEAGEFDVCTIIYARFKSAMTQIVTPQQLIPFALPETEGGEAPAATASGAVYEYEPEEQEILDELLPLNLSVQIFKALLENNASEHGARMTAMDSATRNAGDMISALTLQYNRARQAGITKELIEIVSGADAL